VWCVGTECETYPLDCSHRVTGTIQPMVGGHEERYLIKQERGCAEPAACNFLHVAGWSMPPCVRPTPR
jgi:hypothetical protein